MSEYFRRKRIGNGVCFSSVQDTKFKHNSITINLIVPLDEQTASANALVPFLLRKGSAICPDFTKLEQQLCDLYGAELDAEIGKYWEYQLLSVSISSIDDRFALEKGEDVSGRCAKLLGEILLCPNLVDGLFPQNDFELEKQYLVDTIRSEINDKRSYVLNCCKKEMCKGKRLAIDKYGTLEQAEQITAQSAVNAYYQLIDTARIEIVFVGAGSPKSALETYEKLFGTMERHPFVHTEEPVVTSASEIRCKEEIMEIAQSKMALGMRLGTIANEREWYAAKMMGFLFGGSSVSMLFRNVREKLSLCYYCAARPDLTTGIMLVDMGLERENKEQAIEAIMKELSSLAHGEFTEEELDAAKRSYINSLRSVGDTLSSVENWCTGQILRGRNLTPAQEVEAMNSVTFEEVKAAAAKVQLDTVYFLTGEEDMQNECAE